MSNTARQEIKVEIERIMKLARRLSDRAEQVHKKIRKENK